MGFLACVVPVRHVSQPQCLDAHWFAESHVRALSTDLTTGSHNWCCFRCERGRRGNLATRHGVKIARNIGDFFVGKLCAVLVAHAINRRFPNVTRHRVFRLQRVAFSTLTKVRALTGLQLFHAGTGPMRVRRFHVGRARGRKRSAAGNGGDSRHASRSNPRDSP